MAPTQRAGLASADWEAWRAMEAICDSGRARLLGINNVSLEQLELLSMKDTMRAQRRACRHWSRLTLINKAASFLQIQKNSESFHRQYRLLLKTRKCLLLQPRGNCHAARFLGLHVDCSVPSGLPALAQKASTARGEFGRFSKNLTVPVGSESQRRSRQIAALIGNQGRVFQWRFDSVAGRVESCFPSEHGRRGMT
jgi:hypothetical protein